MADSVYRFISQVPDSGTRKAIKTLADRFIPSGGESNDGITATMAELNTMDGILATVDELNRATDTSTRIVNTTATTLAITAALHGSKIVKVTSAAPIAITLPAATGSGEKYTFVVAVDATATAHTIKVANTADALHGVSVLSTTATGEVTGFATTATDDTISLNGTTKGGCKGDRIEIIDVSTAMFQVSIIGRATGTVATPFSATV